MAPCQASPPELVVEGGWTGGYRCIDSPGSFLRSALISCMSVLHGMASLLYPASIFLSTLPDQFWPPSMVPRRTISKYDVVPVTPPNQTGWHRFVVLRKDYWVTTKSVENEARVLVSCCIMTIQTKLSAHLQRCFTCFQDPNCKPGLVVHLGGNHT